MRNSRHRDKFEFEKESNNSKQLAQMSQFPYFSTILSNKTPANSK